MDFLRAYDTVSLFLEERGHRYAVVGGLALALYGSGRATADLDFVVEAGCQADLVAFLETGGYETLHVSEGYSNHLHADTRLGRIDVVYVRGDTIQKLFSEIRRVPGPGGRTIPVPKPEHLAAMKIQAMKNSPGRVFQELADIRFLLLRPGIDREAVRREFERHGLGERFDEILRTL